MVVREEIWWMLEFQEVPAYFSFSDQERWVVCKKADRSRNSLESNKMFKVIYVKLFFYGSSPEPLPTAPPSGWTATRRADTSLTVTTQEVPEYSGKQMISGDLVIFFSNRSLLLRKRMMAVSLNHLLLQMESKSFRDSCIRFCSGGEGERGAGENISDVCTHPENLTNSQIKTQSVAQSDLKQEVWRNFKAERRTESVLPETLWAFCSSCLGSRLGFGFSVWVTEAKFHKAMHAEL